MEMRKCKECGKLFAPKGREKYCSDVHYRPCPICGEPVEAKYLSDPPKRCAACRHRKMPPLPKELAVKSKSLFNFIPEDGSSNGAGLKQEVEIAKEMEKKSPGSSLDWLTYVEPYVPSVIDAPSFCEKETGQTRMYIGILLKNGFIPGHEYLLKIEKNEYVYNVTATYDITADEECNIMVPYASQISYNQHFRRRKRRGEHSGIGHSGY